MLPEVFIGLLRWSEKCLVSVWGMVALTNLALSLRLGVFGYLPLLRMLRLVFDLVWLLSLTLLLLSSSFCILSSSLSSSLIFSLLLPPITSTFWMRLVFLAIGWTKFLVLTNLWVPFFYPPNFYVGLHLKVTGSISSTFSYYSLV